MPDAGLVGTFLGIALAGAGLALVVRPHLSKSLAATLSFAAPGLVIASIALWAGVRGSALFALPLGATGALFLAAAAIFAPTAQSRFRDFERRFWAHVSQHQRRAS